MGARGGAWDWEGAMYPPLGPLYLPCPLCPWCPPYPLCAARGVGAVGDARALLAPPPKPPTRWSKALPEKPAGPEDPSFVTAPGALAAPQFRRLHCVLRKGAERRGEEVG